MCANITHVVKNSAIIKIVSTRVLTIYNENISHLTEQHVGRGEQIENRWRYGFSAASDSTY